MTHPPQRNVVPLALAALGVVFGDLGTSPLYALQEAFTGPHAAKVTLENVLGVLSLFFWALTLVVSVKYVTFLLRADNHGEGGILALLALTGARDGRRHAGLLIALGLFGAALLYGDGVITPAISVLSAVEGLEVASPALERFVVPLTIVILVALFAVQRFGSGKVGKMFGPVVLVWFITIGVLGAIAIRHEPGVIAALAPRHAVRYCVEYGIHGVPILGAVVLAVTGCEALYADLGHFGARPIRTAWFVAVLPALVLSYFGQGATLLANPEAAERPFYSSIPELLLIPMVVLATVTTVIASQALITAVFSLTRQSLQLGYWPRTHIIHTSMEEVGQVFVPTMNRVVMLATIALVIGFQSSSALAAAYGFAVAGTMAITTCLFVVVARRRWHVRWPLLALFIAVFGTIDIAFLSANAFKILDGGWLPLLIGLVLLMLMQVWAYGRRTLGAKHADRAVSLDDFLADFDENAPVRVPGNAVFLTSHPETAPLTLLHYLKHAKSLHERVIVLSIRNEDVPKVDDDKRIAVTEKKHGFWTVVGCYGFMESPDVPALIERAMQEHELTVEGPTYFLGRESIVAKRGWRQRLFSFMHHNAHPAPAYFQIPPNQVLEVGAQVEL
jgi:KUP system potassium uptake protein